MEAGKSKIWRVGHQAGDLGNSQDCSSSLKAISWQNSLLLNGIKAFNRLDRAHPHYGRQYSLLKVFLNVILIQNNV
jgi:hypothetical protein